MLSVGIGRRGMGSPINRHHDGGQTVRPGAWCPRRIWLDCVQEDEDEINDPIE